MKKRKMGLARMRSKWLVFALSDKIQNKESLQIIIEGHMAHYKTFSKKIDIIELQLELDLINLVPIQLKNFDSQHPKHFIDRYIIAPIRKKCRQEHTGYDSVALLLDRDTLDCRDVAGSFLPTLQSLYFKQIYEPEHYIYCFGGEQDIMTCQDTNRGRICPVTDGRGCCDCPYNTQTTCKHTCYWHLIGRLLNAYPKPLYPKWESDNEIREKLPKIYIY